MGMNIGLLIAGGVGRRMEMNVPKQFLQVEGKPVIMYTLESFQRCADIDAIAVVCLKGWEDELKKWAFEFGITKLKYITAGGATGMESLRNGMNLLRENCSEDDVIIIHDAVRPLVSCDIIKRNIEAVEKYGTAITSLPATEAILYSEEHNENGAESSNVIDRNNIIKTQTPQSLRLSKFVWAHNEAIKRGITDTVATCTLLIELGEKVHIVWGDEMNFKITTPEHIELLKAYLKVRDCK